MNPFLEDRFHALFAFNSEKARGIVHTAEYEEKMRVMQEDYDAKRRRRAVAEDVALVGIAVDVHVMDASLTLS